MEYLPYGSVGDVLVNENVKIGQSKAGHSSMYTESLQSDSCKIR